MIAFLDIPPPHPASTPDGAPPDPLLTRQGGHRDAVRLLKKECLVSAVKTCGKPALPPVHEPPPGHPASSRWRF